jgi:hypothetical protein
MRKRSTADLAQYPKISARDKAFWKSVYDETSRKRQLQEGWCLFVTTVVAILGIGLTWWKWYLPLRCMVLAFLGGLLGGLLQDAKFFYKSVGDGNWIWDKVWWRLLTPLLSGAMGFSVYAIFRGFANAQPLQSGSEQDYYAYGIGFLTGLFADNAIQKLRDVAYAVFGTPKEPAHKPHTAKGRMTIEERIEEKTE